ncbi:MAG: Plug domain-containing protein, partial [Gemmatimonadota bacterium]
MASLLLAGPAFGQQDTVAIRDSSAVRLPTLDVTATATRSTRRPLEQPLAITAIQPSAWLAAPGHSLEKALQFVPGVIAQSRSGGTDIRISIRGFGAWGAGVERERHNSAEQAAVQASTPAVGGTPSGGLNPQVDTAQRLPLRLMGIALDTAPAQAVAVEP